MLLIRHVWLAVGFLLAGCYEAFPPSGAPCSSSVEDSCPSGQSCIRGTCRSLTGGGTDASTIPEVDASTIDGPAADVDNDKVPNASDNCPSTSNSDQHDEDTDGVGDVCDNCPHVSNANQARTGEPTTLNGVGDACDPRPGIPGDTIQKFYSFHVLPPGTTTSGTWAITTDTYQHTGGGMASMVVLGDRDKVTVEVAGTLESTTDFMALAVSVGGASGNYHQCGYLDCINCNGGSTEYLNAFIDYYDAGANDWFDLIGNNMSQRLSGAFTIRVSSDPTVDRVACTTTDTRGSTTRQFNQADALVQGTVGVYSDAASYRLRYMVVFGQP